MAAISTIIGAIGVAATVAGTATAVYGAQQQASAQRKAENIRKNQMENDAIRRTREQVREAQLARATALTNATSQGAEAGSGLQGGYGQIAGRFGTNVQGIQDNLGFGRALFDANAAASEGASIAGMGQGLSSLGGALVKNAGVIGKVGNYFLNNDPYANPTKLGGLY